jgi:hypothetical protein
LVKTKKELHGGNAPVKLFCPLFSTVKQAKERPGSKNQQYQV